MLKTRILALKLIIMLSFEIYMVVPNRDGKTITFFSCNNIFLPKISA